ncbi:hypothetical protein ACF2JD_07910 [Aeromonas sp. A-5]|uniref:hypothetical protein n=1 Tax=Aeromonas ichthyocola TaxID=3367746 RepID=UPI0038DE4678
MATVSDKANVVLDGQFAIWGDVRATGSVTLNGSSPSPGNVNAGSDHYLPLISETGGSLTLKGGHIAGQLAINGNVSMGHGTSIAGGKLSMVGLP